MIEIIYAKRNTSCFIHQDWTILLASNVKIHLAYYGTRSNYSLRATSRLPQLVSTNNLLYGCITVVIDTNYLSFCHFIEMACRPIYRLAPSYHHRLARSLDCLWSSQIVEWH